MYKCYLSTDKCTYFFISNKYEVYRYRLLTQLDMNYFYCPRKLPTTTFQHAELVAKKKTRFIQSNLKLKASSIQFMPIKLSHTYLCHERNQLLFIRFVHCMKFTLSCSFIFFVCQQHNYTQT